MFSLICVWINDWVNNHEAGDFRRYLAHYDVIVMCSEVLDGPDNVLISQLCQCPDPLKSLAHSCHMRSGIVVYQEKLRFDCTSVGPNNRSKNLTLHLSDYHDQANIGPYVLLAKCLPRPLPTHHRTCRAGRCCMPDNAPLCFSRPLRVRRIHLSWTDCHLWSSQGANGELDNSGVLWQTPSGLRDGGVRIKPTNDRRELNSLLRGRFLRVWSEICTSVPRCKSLCRERAVLRLNRLADKTEIPILPMCCDPSAPLSSSPRALASLSEISAMHER